MSRLLSLFLALTIFVTSVLPAPLAVALSGEQTEYYAGIEEHPQDLAIYGLTTYQTADGSFGYDADRRLWQTFAVVRELLAQGYAVDFSLVQKGLNYLDALTPQTTQAESYQIFARHKLGRSVAGEFTSLFAKQNLDGGFGMRMGYNSDAISTLAVLLALAELPTSYQSQRLQAADWLLAHSPITGVSYTTTSPPDYFLNLLTLDALARTGAHRIKERAEVFVRSMAADPVADTPLDLRAYALAVGQRWYGTADFAAAGTADDLLDYQASGGLIAGEPTTTAWALPFLPEDLRLVPHIAAAPASVDFAPVAVGGSATPITITLGNTGNADLTISSLVLDGADKADFQITAGECIAAAIAKSESCSATLSFTPKAAGERTTTLLVFSDDPDEPSLRIPITGSAREKLRLTLSLKRTFANDSSSVYAVAYADEQVIAAGADGVIRIWAVDTGELVSELAGHSGAIYSLAVADETLVSGGADGAVRVWNLANLSLMQTLTGHTAAVNAVTVSGDAILSASNDDTVRVWDRATGVLVRTMTSHTADVWALATDGTIAVSGGWDETMQIWELASGAIQRTISVSPDIVTTLALTPDRIIAGLDSGGIGVWDRATGQLVRMLTGHTDWINDLEVVGELLLSAADDATIRAWDLDSGALQQVLPSQTGSVWSLAAGSGQLFSGSAPATIQQWDSAPNTPPIATNLELAVLAGETVTGSLHATDPNSDQLAYFIVRQPRLGTIVLNAVTGEYTYTPEIGKFGTDSFEFGASDGLAGSNAATVTIEVARRVPQISASFDSHDFGEFALGESSAAQQLSLASLGNVPLRIDAVLVDGPAASEFALTGASGCQGELSPASSCALTITFQPQAGGLREAALTIYSNDLAHSMLALPLTGVGTTTLTLTKTGDGQGSVAFAAVATSDSAFTGWSEPHCSGSPSCTISLAKNSSFEAAFAKSSGLLSLLGAESVRSETRASVATETLFIENRGQIADPQVKYYAQTFGGMVYVLADGEVAYILPEQPKTSSQQAEASLQAAESEGVESNAGVILREDLGGSRLFGLLSDTEVRGEGRAETTVNYLTGSDRTKWIRAVPSFEFVSLGQAFAGVELKLRATGSNVEKLFFVQPEADPSVISVELAGSQKLSVDPESGELVSVTELGEVRFTAPVAYQEVAGVRQSVAVKYWVSGDRYGFEVGEYDPAYELVIDPLLASTFFQTGGWYGTNLPVAVDSHGDILIAGYTQGFDFPIGATGYQKSLGGSHDAFVAKLDPQLAELKAVTYLGGNGSDQAYDLALDPTGNVFITGVTSSINFPVTAGSYQTQIAGNYDSFVAKLDPALSQLLASTLSGGSGYDWSRGIAIAPDGTAWIAGETTSGSTDGLVESFNSALTTRKSQTTFGGSYFERANSVAVFDGSIYVVAQTERDGIASGGWQTSHGGDNSDAFVLKLDAQGNQLASTYLGGSGFDFGSAIAANASGVFVVGHSRSSNFFRNVSNPPPYYAGYSDGFIVQLTPDLKSFVAGNHIGGSGYDSIYDLALTPEGRVFVLGESNSTNLPSSANAYQNSLKGNTDLFLASLSSTLAVDRLTYFGGAALESAHSITTDQSGSVIFTAGTESTDFPLKSNAYQKTRSSGTAMTISRLDATLTRGPPHIASALTRHTFATDSSSTAQTFTLWNDGDQPLSIASASIIGANPDAFTITANNCSAVTLAPTQSCAVSIRYTASDADVRSAALSISSSDPVEPTLNILLTGTTETAAMLTKRGAGSGAVTLTAMPSIGSYFAGWTGACTGMQTCAVTLDNHRSVQAIFRSERDAKVTITPAQHDFSDVSVATSGSRSFTITNTGNENLIIENMALSGAAATDYTLTSNTCSGATVKPLISCSLQVVFTPAAEGERIASLIITSNAKNQRTLAVPLTGIGVTTLAITKTGDGSGSVVFAPTPLAASTFAGWDGDCTGLEHCTVDLSQHHDLAASFTADSGSTPLGLLAAPEAIRVASGSIPFLANQGQIDNPAVRYYAQTAHGTVYVLESGEVVYSLPELGRDGQDLQEVTSSDETLPQSAPTKSMVFTEKFGAKNSLFDTLLSGGVRGEQRTQTAVHYLLGNDPSAWRSDIPAYNFVNLGEVFEGVEVKLRATGSNIEKLFFVQPGASPSQIRVDLSGAQSLAIAADGELVVTRADTETRFTKPVAFQIIAGQRREVEVSYLVSGSSYGFQVGRYDPRFELVIDPLLATVLAGGSQSDWPIDTAVDASGNVYIAGTTESADFPDTTGTLSPAAGSSNRNGFILKYSPDLKQLLAATYFGGTSYDQVSTLKIDQTGRIIMSGATESSNFPLAATGGRQRTYAGGRDGFVIALSSDLRTILAATFVGGEGLDEVYSFLLDANNALLLALHSTSRYLDGVFLGRQYANKATVLMRLDSNLQNMTKYTIIGDNPYAQPSELIDPALIKDNQNNIFVIGHAVSSRAILKFNSNLDRLAWRYFDTSMQVQEIATDAAGDIYLAGWSSYGLSNSTAGFQSVNQGNADGFIAKMDKNLTDFVLATHLGGELGDYIYDLKIDASGDIWAAGSTQSARFPVTGGVYQARNINFTNDGFVSRLSPDLTRLKTSTYLGGRSSDYIRSILLSPTGNLIAAGDTSSTDFPGVSASAAPVGQNVFVSAITLDLTAGSASSFASLTHHSFASTPLGTSSEQNVTITNTSDNFLEITQLALSGANSADFTIKSDGCSHAYLVPTGSCALTVGFTPSLSGLRTASLAIHSNDTATPIRQISLSGAGNSDISLTKTGTAVGRFTLAALPAAGSIFAGWEGESCSGVTNCVVTTENHKSLRAKFIQLTDAKISISPAESVFVDTLAETQSEPTLFTIRNIGTSELKVGELALSGSNAAEFKITLDRCSRQIIAIGATCSVKVALAPQSEGSKSAMLRVPSNDPNQLVASIQLSGVGQTRIVVTKTGTGDGSVVLTGLPDTGAEFAGWGGESCAGGAECSVELGADRSIAGSFHAPASPLSLLDAEPAAVSALANATLPFVENRGQIPNAEVKYYAQTFGGMVFVLRSGEVVYSLPERIDGPSAGQPGTSDSQLQTNDSPQLQAATPNAGVILREDFGHEPSLLGSLFGGGQVRGESRSETQINYFLGDDESKWVRDAPAYELLSLGEVYAGIELKLRATNANVEKLFFVQPDADPRLIAVPLAGATGLSIDAESGELIAQTQLGEVRFTAPVAYQEVAGARQSVAVKYWVSGDRYGFEVGEYDHSRELVIDPLLASTFVGGGNYPVAGVEIAKDGSVYITGSTYYGGLSVTESGYQKSIMGERDVFVARFDNSLTKLISATYLGGWMSDNPKNMKIDNSGNIILVGETYSSNFPVSANAYQKTLSTATNYSDVFIAKLNGSLSSLITSTYLGGTDIDYAQEVIIDLSGSIIVAGMTYSDNFPGAGRPSGYGQWYYARNVNVFMSKFDPGLSTLQSSRYFGRPWSDSISSLVIDDYGNIFWSGASSGSPNVGVFWSSQKNLFNCSASTILDTSFIMQLNSGLGEVTSTCGPSSDLAVNNNSIFALTMASNLPTTVGAYQTEKYYYNNPSDLYIAKLDKNLSQILSATYLGNSAYEMPYDMSIDKNGDLYISGYTTSGGLSNVDGSYRKNISGGYTTSFVAKLKNDLSNLLAIAVVGGGGSYTDTNAAHAITLDADGNVFIVNNTPTNNEILKLDPALSAEPPKIYTPSPYFTFAEVPVGKTLGDQIISIYNQSPTTLTVYGSQVRITGPAANDFFLKNHISSDYGISGNGLNFNINFRPTAVGVRRAWLEIPSNDPDTPMLRIELIGAVDTRLTAVKSGLKSGRVRLTAVPAAGSRFIGWEGPTCSGPTVCELGTQFNQSVSARFAADLSPKVAVDLTGYVYDDVLIGADPVLYDTPAEMRGIQTFTLTNTGRAHLSIGSVVLRGVDANQFIIKSDTCAQQTIPPGATCAVGVRFAPAVEGAYRAELVIFSNYPDQPEFSVPLNGVRRGVVTAGAPTKISFPFITASAQDQVLTITPNDYFYVSDLRANPAGFFTTLSLSDLTSGGFTILVDNVSLRADKGVEVLAGRAAPEVRTSLNATNFTAFAAGTPMTILDRPAHAGTAAGKYGIRPTFQLRVPAWTPPGQYTGTLSFTLVER